jgi:ParB family chromosome partitioning protein
MCTDNGYQLLAGLRRLKAIEFLGFTEIEVNIIELKDAEDILHIEISENEQRKSFTFSEKVYFGKLLADIEKIKAKERMVIGGQGGFNKVGSREPTLGKSKKGRTTERIGSALGVSRATYERMNYIVENAPQKIIDELDKGERTIRATYDELRDKKKAASKSKTQTKTNSSIPKHSSSNVKNNPLLEKFKKQETESIRKQNEFKALSPEGKITELQRQLKEARARAAKAESKLSREKELRKSDLFHFNTTNEMLENQLKEAYIRIAELEKKYESCKNKK